jgi:hypothetical protein
MKRCWKLALDNRRLLFDFLDLVVLGFNFWPFLEFECNIESIAFESKQQ